MSKKSTTMAILLALVLPMSVMAQGGLFQRGDVDDNYYSRTEETYNALLFRNMGVGGNLFNQGFGNPIDGSDLTNQTFGAPLNSGLLLVLLASVTYAKLKKNKNNRKENQK